MKKDKMYMKYMVFDAKELDPKPKQCIEDVVKRFCESGGLDYSGVFVGPKCFEVFKEIDTLVYKNRSAQDFYIRMTCHFLVGGSGNLLYLTPASEPSLQIAEMIDLGYWLNEYEIDRPRAVAYMEYLLGKTWSRELDNLEKDRISLV